MGAGAWAGDEKKKDEGKGHKQKDTLERESSKKTKKIDG
jgi:hypothetical protein